MTQVFEYIMQHYALFLGGAILILLAIIGYYADKTNFGQGKTVQNNEDADKITDIKNLRLSDVTNGNNGLKQNESDQVLQTSPENTNVVSQNIQNNVNRIIGNGIVQDPNQTLIEDSNNNLTAVNSVLQNETITNQNIIVSQNMIDQSVVEQNAVNEGVAEENIESSTNDQNINVENNISTEKTSNDSSLISAKEFDDEFNSILPKKELISGDLLSDIDDLELDKTQKLNLNDIPILDDIKLPKIKSSVIDNDDIWKF